MAGDKLTHLTGDGSAYMVDVADKNVTRREAVASGRVMMSADTLAAILAGDAKKGDVIGTARIAGIMAAKKTHELIPLCHPLMLSKINIDIDQGTDFTGLSVTATVSLSGKTGVEMETLTAVSVACLTIYDMAKALEKDMEIGDIKLISKTGGKSGTWTRGA
ncbi:cyclic pyranopterin monophosphate synthase MoaC [Ahrensia kielensis]|uniref:Cyclic pyranopterin monophosphate synthase n=1 Tax=Ahrensia kielensis TaxID=76980 RepID=A0ABU9T408_9HYPH